MNEVTCSLDTLGELFRSVVADELKAFEARLIPPQAHTVEDAAILTGYKEWTLRQACNKNRIRGAYKASDRSWRIPHTAIEQIQAYGLPSKQVA